MNTSPKFRLAACKAGELYVNVHSADHKPGEICGQLMPPAAPKSSY